MKMIKQPPSVRTSMKRIFHGELQKAAAVWQESKELQRATLQIAQSKGQKDRHH